MGYRLSRASSLRRASRRSPRRARGWLGLSASTTSRSPETSSSLTSAAVWPRATDPPLNIDSERCYPNDPGGGRRDRSRCSRTPERQASRSEGYDRRPRTPSTALGLRVRARRSRSRSPPGTRASHWCSPVTPRATIHSISGIPDTITRLIPLSQRRASAHPVSAPGLTQSQPDHGRCAGHWRARFSVLTLPNGPTVAELASVGVRRSLGRQPARRSRVRGAHGRSARAAGSRHVSLRRVHGLAGGVERRLRRLSANRSAPMRPMPVRLVAAMAEPRLVTTSTPSSARRRRTSPTSCAPAFAS